MAGQDALTNCKIRRMPISQRGGLGVYATEDIEYAQELLMVNWEYPFTPDEASQADAPHLATQTPTSADTEVMAEMSTTDIPGISLYDTLNYRQYARLDELGE
jgi:hypothetical protein